MTDDRQGPAPPLPIRAIARGMSNVIARAPFLWPVLRRPTRSFCISDAMVRQAEQKTPAELKSRVRFEVADAGSLPYDPETFDLVCQLNLPLYADAIVRVLAPGGHVLIASSRGSRTPYYTPDRILRRRFEQHGLEALPGGRAGEGTYFLARRP